MHFPGASAIHLSWTHSKPGRHFPAVKVGGQLHDPQGSPSRLSLIMLTVGSGRGIKISLPGSITSGAPIDETDDAVNLYIYIGQDVIL